MTPCLFVDARTRRMIRCAGRNTINCSVLITIVLKYNLLFHFSSPVIGSWRNFSNRKLVFSYNLRADTKIGQDDVSCMNDPATFLIILEASLKADFERPNAAPLESCTISSLLHALRYDHDGV